MDLCILRLLNERPHTSQGLRALILRWLLYAAPDPVPVPPGVVLPGDVGP